MLKIKRKIFDFLVYIKEAVDKNYIFSSLNQLSTIVFGIIQIVVIPIFLTPEMQGYWFTMSSLLALNLFLDLGFALIIYQFSAQEYAHLNEKSGHLAGEETNLIRLASLFKFCIQWSIFVISLGYSVIFIAGIFILSQNASYVEWIFPWLILVISSGLSFFLLIILNFIEGLNKVAKIENMRLKANIIQILSVIMMLSTNFNLYSLGFGLFLESVVLVILLIKNYHQIFTQLLATSKIGSYNWKPRFFSLLKRYAMSYIGGYLLFNIYVPLMFYFHGSIEAGKLGLTLTIFQSIYTFSCAWISAIIPRMNMSISLKKWNDLDKLFKRNFVFTVLTYLICILGFIIAKYILQNYFLIFNRISDDWTLLLICCIFLFLVTNYALSMYLRGHNQEPFAILNLLAGIYALIATIVLGMYFIPDLFLLGFISQFFWNFPLMCVIFFRKRRKWHEEVK